MTKKYFTRKSNESLLPILIVSWLSRLKNFHYSSKINLKSSFMIFFTKLLTCTYPFKRRDYVTYFYLLLLQGKASWSDKFDESHWKRIGFGCIWSIGSYHGKLRKIIYNDTFLTNRSNLFFLFPNELVWWKKVVIGSNTVLL